MTKETYWQQVRGALIAMTIAVIMLPILGPWTLASWIETVIRKIKGA